MTHHKQLITVKSVISFTGAQRCNRQYLWIAQRRSRDPEKPKPWSAAVHSLSFFSSFLSFSITLPVLLQNPYHICPRIDSATLFTPRRTLTKTFLCKSNIQTSNICRHRSSPSTSSPTHLLSLLSLPFSQPNNTPLKPHRPSLSLGYTGTLSPL